MAWTIYALCEPVPLEDAGDVRYVGFTTDMARRLANHRSEASNPKHQNYHCHKSRWVRRLISVGLFPHHVVLETGTDMGLWKAAEKHWIAHYREAGARLTNATDGGEGTPGKRHSAETKAKIGARSKVSQRGRKHSPETRAKMSASRIAAWQDPEQRAHMADGRREAGLSPDGRARLSARARAYRPTPEAIEKCAAKLRGRKAPPEVCKKLSEAVRRRLAVPGALEAQRARLRGGKHTKLTAEKVREIRAAVENGEMQTVVAARYGIDSSTVCHIVKRRCWRDI